MLAHPTLGRVSRTLGWRRSPPPWRSLVEGGLAPGLDAPPTGASWSSSCSPSAPPWLAGRGRQRCTAGRGPRGPLSVRRHWWARPAATVAARVWVALVLAAVVGWDLNSFVHQSHDLPTLSSIIGHVTASRAGRAAAGRPVAGPRRRAWRSDGGGRPMSVGAVGLGRPRGRAGGVGAC